MNVRPSKPWGAVAAIGLFLVTLTLAGCGDSYPKDLTYGARTDPLVTQAPKTAPSSLGAPGQWPYLLPAFTEGSGKGSAIDPAKLVNAEQRDQFAKTLTELFGTPAEPKVAMPKEMTDDDLRMLRLDAATLAKGSQFYRRHCLHCHGLTGDGHGPTASWVNPHPRDYRPGKFKFTSSSQSLGTRKPRREDLLRVLRQGVEGTSMPSFGLLPEEELQQLASYVTHLSIRGQCEYDAMKELFADEGKPSAKQVDAKVRDLLPEIIGYWRDAETTLINPTSQPKSPVPGMARTSQEREALAASITRGHQLFLGAGGGTSCISCHMNYGRKLNLMWDDWGTVTKPTDLTTGIYRGGRRPIDIFWRIHAGINGTGMPAFPDTASPLEKEENMWHVVNFVLALPYPKMLPKNIENEIYPPPVSEVKTAARDAD